MHTGTPFNGHIKASSFTCVISQTSIMHAYMIYRYRRATFILQVFDDRYMAYVIYFMALQRFFFFAICRCAVLTEAAISNFGFAAVPDHYLRTIKRSQSPTWDQQTLTDNSRDGDCTKAARAVAPAFLSNVSCWRGCICNFWKAGCIWLFNIVIQVRQWVCTAPWN